MFKGPDQNDLAWSGSKEAGLGRTICSDKYINNQPHFIKAQSDLGSAKYDCNVAFCQIVNFALHISSLPTLTGCSCNKL